MDQPSFDITMTPGVNRHTTEEERQAALQKHAAEDWGTIDPEDAEQNNWALENPDRAIVNGTKIMGEYPTADGTVFWIITDLKRATTRLLLPAEC